MECSGAQYYKRRWDEPRGDEYDHWGFSWWFFETTVDGEVLRQIEVYDSGPSHRYDQEHVV